ncbi:MAG: hypothetical protein K2Y35_19265 [Burkholderiales bacterium]|nr:hypothetical protein [Burkholderiales bacterium]
MIQITTERVNALPLTTHLPRSSSSSKAMDTKPAIFAGVLWRIESLFAARRCRAAASTF